MEYHKWIQQRVSDLSKKEEWNHQYDYPGLIKTRKTDINSPGYNLNKWARLDPIIDKLNLKGKTVLDIGCSDGYYSVKCAIDYDMQVVGIDPDPLRIERANFIKQIFKLDNIEFGVADLYELKENKNYDMILGLGLLHRIPNVLQCLQKMSKLSNLLILEFKTYDSLDDLCVSGGHKSKSNKYNKLHSIPTQTYVNNRMKELGFNNNTFYNDESHLNYKRTILVSSREK